VRASVAEAFVRFTAPLEGVVPFMYLDVKGLVTTAIGNLIDPIQYALPLPFRHKDGTPATKSEIAAEWNRVKGHQAMRMRGGMAYASVTTLRLDKAGIDQVVQRKLAQNVDHLKRRFAQWDEWPADAQLATLSMAWACGPAFRFPMLTAALRAQRWAIAAVECRMDERGNPGLAPRNVANRHLFMNADAVVRGGYDLNVLYYPDVPRPRASPDAETLPELPESPPSGPVLEDDGGESRRRATTDAIIDAVRDAVLKRNT